MSHTPGPWRIATTHSGALEIMDDHATRLLATIHQGKPTREGNAALIVAAPDMLAALKLQHNALDILCAMLITLTREHTPDDQFFPSKVPALWDALVAGNAAIAKAGS